MEFNKKCKVLHLGRSKPTHHPCWEPPSWKAPWHDPGILVDAKWDTRQQCVPAALTASSPHALVNVLPIQVFLETIGNYTREERTVW